MQNGASVRARSSRSPARWGGSPGGGGGAGGGLKSTAGYFEAAAGLSAFVAGTDLAGAGNDRFDVAATAASGVNVGAVVGSTSDRAKATASVWVVASSMVRRILILAGPLAQSTVARSAHAVTEQASNHCGSPTDSRSPPAELGRPPPCKIPASKPVVDNEDGVVVGVGDDDAVDNGFGFGCPMAPGAATARSRLSRR